MISATCIEWMGRLDRDGYGRIGDALAHRVAWIREREPIPAGLQLDHLCRNRRCVNLDHLELVTSRENTLRSPIAIAAINSRKITCKNGHPFDDANTYHHNGERKCRTCNAAVQRRRKQRRRATA